MSPTDDLAKMLEAAIEAGDGQAGLWCIDDTSLIGRHVGLLPGAQTVLQTVGDTPTWEQRIDTLRDAIAERPDLLDHAFIRTAYQRTGGWRSIAMATPIPHADESLFRYNQHLTTTHVIDAHGIQVLTDAHLARLQNPDRWNIEDLGHGKHLVTAPDLAAWYADTTPNAATLEQARDDFADLLLTDDAVSTHPPPWQPRG